MNELDPHEARLRDQNIYFAFFMYNIRIGLCFWVFFFQISGQINRFMPDLIFIVGPKFQPKSSPHIGRVRSVWWVLISLLAPRADILLNKTRYHSLPENNSFLTAKNHQGRPKYRQGYNSRQPTVRNAPTGPCCQER